MPDFDITVPHIALSTITGWAGRTTLVKWFRDGRTVVIQARHDSYSNIESLTVRELYRACMGFISDFSDGGS